MLSRTRRHLALGSALIAAALAVSACGAPPAAPTPLPRPAAAVSGCGVGEFRWRLTGRQVVAFNLTPDQNRVTTAKVDTIAAEVPQAIRDRGTLLVTGTRRHRSAAWLLRDRRHDDHRLRDRLRLPDRRVCWVSRSSTSAADWAQNFVRIDSGEADAFISNVTVTEERKEKYDFATYRLDTLALETQKDTDWTVNGRQDLAGKIIAVGSGTNQEKILVDWNDANVAEGLAPIDIKYFQNSTDYYLALSSGRIDGYFGPNPTAQYHVAQHR